MGPCGQKQLQISNSCSVNIMLDNVLFLIVPGMILMIIPIFEIAPILLNRCVRGSSLCLVSSVQLFCRLSELKLFQKYVL